MFSPKFEVVKDDSLQCWLFLDKDLSDDATHSFVNDLKAFIKQKSGSYIWHKDEFVILQPVQFGDLPHHLYSITYFGDNIEDEWFIVYLLLEISKTYQDLVIKVNDNDGEFLMIEAADFLPQWATPDTTENRVFIFKGSLHLIPIELIDGKEKLTVQKSIDLIRNNSVKTKATHKINEVIMKRIAKFPNEIEETLHRCTVYMPRKYAVLLKHYPSLIAQSVNVYCGLDAFESKYCKNFKAESCVDTTVVFTKCLYAMLSHARVIPSLTWKLPPNNSERKKRETLGYKITCGFEVLLNKASQDTFSTSQWATYLSSLRKNGYFKNNIEGSKPYTQLLEDAKKYYVANECSNIKSYVGNEIKKILDGQEFQQLCNQFDSTNEKLIEENDNWLNVQPEQLNDILHSRYGKQNKFSDNDVITPQIITNEINKFLHKKSDLEGIDLNEDRETNDTNDDTINFDCDQFIDAVKNILDFAVPEDNWNLDSGTDLSEYGSESEMEPDVNAITAELDKELSSSTLSASFATSNDSKRIDVPKNLFANLKQSLNEELGSSGPSSNLLAGLGIPKHAVPELDSDDDIE